MSIVSLASSPPCLGSLYLGSVNPTGFPFVFLSSQPEMTRAREPREGCVGAARWELPDGDFQGPVMGGTGEVPVDCILAVAESKFLPVPPSSLLFL